MTESTMRTAVGEYDFEDILHDREKLNKNILENAQKAADDWGLQILRCEVNILRPSNAVLEAMNEKVLNDIENRKQVHLFP